MYQDAYFQIGQAMLAGQKLQAVDVGGAGGLLPHWTVFQGNTKFYMYEPREDACQQIRSAYANSRFASDIFPICTALSGTGGLRKLYITNSPTCSSLLRPNVADERYKDNAILVPFKEQLIRTQTIADSLTEEGVEHIDAIKLDVQGAELEILKGLNKERLDTLLLIETEVGLCNIYEGTPTLGEVFEFMEANGMELYDMRTQRSARYFKNGVDTYNGKYFGVGESSPTISAKVYELDVIFMKKTSLVLAQGAAATRRMIFCQCVYNFVGEAMYLIEEAQKCSIFSKEEENQLVELVSLWQQVNSKVLADYDRVLQATQGKVWTQYAWTPYPNM